MKDDPLFSETGEFFTAHEFLPLGAEAIGRSEGKAPCADVKLNRVSGHLFNPFAIFTVEWNPDCSLCLLRFHLYRRFAIQ
ncbi:hypothetical protein [Martelella soudanensis]|uniref:hypothetical protein n=1 Tax=unclassified Martelella TaxID=2629616 RepID=UPI0015DE95D9|nr:MULTISPECIES: hypothetical protein [unclassified Martelella]